MVLAAFVGVAATVSFWWYPDYLGVHGWYMSGDLWATYRSAHWVAWGAESDLYTTGDGLVTFPGITVVLFPVTMLTSHFSMSEAWGPFFVPYPTAWLVLGPVNYLLGTTPVFAVDAVAEFVGVSKVRRALLCLLVATVVYQLVAVWGHPEDSLALALALYAMLAVLRHRWTAAGWLWGFAVVTQPLTLLMWPVLFTRCPRGKRVRYCLYTALPTSVLLAVPLAEHWGQTARTLFHQPNYPRLDHATPWVALSPHLGPGAVGAGPGRMIAVALAGVLGVAAARYRPSDRGIIWLAALAMSLRCVFESVMDPFYLAPPLAVILLAAACRIEGWRLVGSWGVAMSATLLSYHRDGPWMYWTPMVVFLAVGVALAWPGLAQLVTGPAGGREPLATQDKDATADGEPSAVPVFPAGFVAVVSAEAVVHADAVASLAPGRRRSRAWR